jgi:hypothetical protein
MYSFRLYRPRKDGWVFWGTWSANGYQSAARICHYATRDGMAKEGRLVGVEREDGSGKSFNLKVHVGWAGNTPVHENVHVRLR